MKKYLILVGVLLAGIADSQDIAVLGIYDGRKWTPATGTKIPDVGELFKLKWLKPEVWTLAGYEPAAKTGYFAGALVNRFELNAKTSITIGGAWGFDQGQKLKGGVVIGVQIKL